MVKKNNVLFCIEYAGKEHPCVYWGTRIPTKDEAMKYINEIGHSDFLANYPEGITDVFPIVNYEQAETLWDLNKEYPHFIIVLATRNKWLDMYRP